MTKRTKQHSYKYLFYGILIFIFCIILCIISFSLIYSVKENKKMQTDYSRFDVYISNMYRNHPETFSFDENGIFELNLEELQQAFDSVQFTVPMTSNLDECLGNIIIKKEETGKLIYDYSHICEMRDY